MPARETICVAMEISRCVFGPRTLYNHFNGVLDYVASDISKEPYSE